MRHRVIRLSEIERQDVKSLAAHDYVRKQLDGRRVELVRCTDPYTTLKPGAKGTVDFVDALGTVHVKWDDGRSLGLVPGEDTWEVLPKGDE
jgi:hypothetical protein